MSSMSSVDFHFFSYADTLGSVSIGNLKFIRLFSIQLLAIFCGIGQLFVTGRVFFSFNLESYRNSMTFSENFKSICLSKNLKEYDEPQVSLHSKCRTIEIA